MRLIDADALADALFDKRKNYPQWVADTICNMPTVDALELLKEQEAVEPKCQIIFDVPYYFCGNCKTMLNMYAVKAKYCSNCARRVKWK